MEGRVNVVYVRPILQIEPSGTARENGILIRLLHYVDGGIPLLVKGSTMG